MAPPAFVAESGLFVDCLLPLGCQFHVHASLVRYPSQAADVAGHSSAYFYIVMTIDSSALLIF